ncbi:MAG: protein kinase [Polyangiaceae bacterium]
MGPGDVLREKYELVESIGKGGMGEVFRTIHLESDSLVAIKVVSRVLLDDVLIARLEREALAAGRISSRFVPHVLEIDRTDDGELFLVMELLFGESLSERLRAGAGTVPWEDVRLIGDNVLRGLIDAHAAGVVHRDLKPGNIFLETLENGGMRAKILDFGVCKLDIADTEKLTMTGESVGTIAYMAPEQIRGASKVNERADLYSFAMVIFEMLSGRLAYDAQGQIALLASKLEKSANPLRHSALVPIPAGLDVIIDTCLARDPTDRYASALEVLDQWRSLGAATLGPAPMDTAPVSYGNPPTETGLTAPTILTTSTPSASRASLALAVGAVIASSIIVAAVVHRRTVAAAAASPIDSSLVAPAASSFAVPETSATSPTNQTSPPTEVEDLDIDAVPITPKLATHPHHVKHSHPPTQHHTGEPTLIDKPRF